MDEQDAGLDHRSYMHVSAYNHVHVAMQITCLVYTVILHTLLIVVAGVPHCTVMHQPFNIIHRPVATHCTASPLAPVSVLYTGHMAVHAYNNFQEILPGKIPGESP